MKTPETILRELGEPFPPQAIKQRQGAGNRMYSYVEAHSVIHRLNSATNGTWSFVVRSHEWRNDLLIVLGELTIPELGTRSGFGVQKVAGNAGEDLIKGAASDSLKKCASQFGVALDLYGPDYEAGEVVAMQQHPPRQQQARQQFQQQGRPPQQQASAPGMATEKQVGALYGITRSMGWSRDDLEKYLGKAPDTLSIEEASSAIKDLNAMKAENGGQ